MTSKKARARFGVNGFTALREKHYTTKADAVKALDTNPKTLDKIENNDGVTKATALKIMRRYAALHNPKMDIEDLIIELS